MGLTNIEIFSPKSRNCHYNRSWNSFESIGHNWGDVRACLNFRSLLLGATAGVRGGFNKIEIFSPYFYPDSQTKLLEHSRSKIPEFGDMELAGWLTGLQPPGHFRSFRLGKSLGSSKFRWGIRLRLGNSKMADRSTWVGKSEITTRCRLDVN